MVKGTVATKYPIDLTGLRFGKLTVIGKIVALVQRGLRLLAVRMIALSLIKVHRMFTFI